jgi:hypothetical protein
MVGAAQEFLEGLEILASRWNPDRQRSDDRVAAARWQPRNWR